MVDTHVWCAICGCEMGDVKVPDNQIGFVNSIGICRGCWEGKTKNIPKEVWKVLDAFDNLRDYHANHGSSNVTEDTKVNK